MKIIDFYYDADWKTLTVEFSTKEDGDNFYRTLELEFSEVEFYSPSMIGEEDMGDIDNDFVVELIDQFAKENDLPEPIEL